ncbi:MAG TPA: hydrocarbon degradation protein [Leucothrix mucor]|uniref:Hydrocarbon degradation protein n=1 Tax=Leucothrix mucor TaxID=45248 RepID=A0A7V2T454_LEUMU|nr:hydrocarbon degradation protein [Leucothrix mucor]
MLKKSLLAVSLSLSLAAPAVFATNGLAPTGVGQEHKAMGGAAVGNPVNTMSMATNPASASFIGDGWDVELELFKPNRTVTRTAGLPSKTFKGNEKSIFVIPGGGYKKQLNNKYAVGVAVYGNGGMNTEFKSGPSFISSGAAGFPPAGTEIPFSRSTAHSGINLEQLFVSPTLGIKLNENHGVGVSLNLVYQQFKAQGLGSLAGNSSSPSNFTGKGTDSATGVGATVGWMGKLSDTTTMGASYRLETKMGKFKKYKGLFPNQGRMNVPAAFTIGLSHQATPKTKLAIDLQQIYYSKLDSIGNSSTNGKKFGETNGPGFGWDDQTIIKLGIKHQLNPKLALMGGYNHGDSPVKAEDTFFGALTPAVVEDHLSLGFEYKLNKKASVLGSYTHTFSNKVKGDLAKRTPFDLEMDQDAIGIGYSVKF